MCLQFEIVGDVYKEADETFTITVEAEYRFDIISGASQVTVTIEDDNDRESLNTKWGIGGSYNYDIVLLCAVGHGSTVTTASILTPGMYEDCFCIVSSSK